MYMVAFDQPKPIKYGINGREGKFAMKIENNENKDTYYTERTFQAAGTSWFSKKVYTQRQNISLVVYNLTRNH